MLLLLLRLYFEAVLRGRASLAAKRLVPKTPHRSITSMFRLESDGESSDEIADPSDEIYGVLVQRSHPVRRHPPAKDQFCANNPDETWPVLCLQLELQSSGSDRARPSERVRVELWGPWSDRLSDFLHLRDVITIAGASTEVDERAAPGSRTLVTMAPTGTPANAKVLIESVERDVEVTANAVRQRTKPAVGTASAHADAGRASGLAGTGVAPPAAPPPPGYGALARQLQLPPAPATTARPAAAPANPAKRQRGGSSRSYEYTRIADLPVTQESGRKEVHVFGVVVEYTLPKATRGSDLVARLVIVDESCASPTDGLCISFFKQHPVPAGIGSVVRFHRVQVMD